MTKPDILLRQADFERRKNNNLDIIILKPKWFIEILAVAYKDEKILKHIKEPMNKNKSIVEWDL